MAINIRRHSLSENKRERNLAIGRIAVRAIISAFTLSLIIGMIIFFRAHHG
ncbi:MAG: hypothetical protein KC505_00730 [Myxococcales bacterium]|nr:hypothetical protein [Myxococcales bacterium]USN51341.1 MAG: hypothetical protein H6731_02740 [Myxococcales bacterium]